MERSAFNTKIKNLHNEFDLSKWEVDGLKVWPLILYIFVRHFQGSTISSLSASLTRKAVNELRSLLSETLAVHNDRNKNASVSDSTEVLLLTSSARRVLVDGLYFDRMTDPFVEAFREIGKECATLEWTYDHKYRFPRFNNSFPFQFEFNKAVLLSFLKKDEHGLEGLPVDRLQKILDDVKPGVDLVKTFNRDYKIITFLKDYFIRQIKNSKSKVAFYYPHYNLVSFAFCLACKHLKIKTVEIQHGTIYSEHSQFSVLGDIPEVGYQLLPDYFWAWDETNLDALESLLMPEIRPNLKSFLGGNLWNQMWIEKPPLDEGFYSSLPSFQGAEYSKVITLTLTASVEFPEWLVEIIHSNEKKYFWYVRFHHSTVYSEINILKSKITSASNVDWQYANDLPLPALLKISGLHVTLESSAVSEAEVFGVPSLIVTSRGAALLQTYIKKGVAKYVNNSHDFYSGVNDFQTNNVFENNNTSVKIQQTNADRVKKFLELV